MKYRIQTFHPSAGCFINTDQESEDLEELKRLALSNTFAGARIRIVDETEALRFAPPVQKRKGELPVADIAKTSHKWPRYALAAVVLFFVAAIVWMVVITYKVEQERNFSAPIQTH